MDVMGYSPTFFCKYCA